MIIIKLYYCEAKVFDKKTDMNIIFKKHLVAEDRSNAISEMYRLMAKSLDREETDNFTWEVMELKCHNISQVYGYKIKLDKMEVEWE